ncbi:MAG: response regulator [Elusimicrobia bacterium]|nr:response regulator [Elusimicrobiota bacterium]
MDREYSAKILLVDDQPEGLLAIETVLEGLGQNLVKARSGKEALWHLLREEYAVVLLDVQMPDMDGFELAALIRERDKSRRTPIIFMTAAYKSEDQVFRGYELGAVDYILKPIVPEILRSKVSVFVDLDRQTHTIRRQSELLREAERRQHEKQIEDALAFSHAVSHDLRAPLRHIESFSGILVQTYGDKLDDRGRDYLQRLAGAAKKMMRLIEAMLQLSEATRVEVHREIVDLSRIAASLEAEFRQSEPQRQVDFIIQDGITAAGDSHLLRVALANLLCNAWKYTGKRARARIEFGKTDLDGLPVYFVRDDGAGFDMSHANKLFLPFGRLHARSDFEGTGIGLATVQRIIHRHGGRIWGEGRVGQGATFFFTLSHRAAAVGSPGNGA